MSWDEWRSSAGFAANITSLAFKFAESFKGKDPTPQLRMSLYSTGGGSGIDFSVRLSETRNQVPAYGVYVIAELDQDIGVVWEAPPFNLGAGELDRLIMFSIERPKYGEIVKACGDETTLYGRTLTVTAVSDDGGYASEDWHEKEYEPGSDRWRAMQAASRFARGDDPDPRAQMIYDMHLHEDEVLDEEP